MRCPDTGRAVHPKIRPQSLRHYAFFEGSGSSSALGPAADAARGKQCVGLGTVPSFVDACTPRARRFSALRTDSLAEASNDAELSAALLEDWTFQTIVRAWSGLALVGTVVSHGGANNANPLNNVLLSLRVSFAGVVTMFWMNGAGVNVFTSFPNYTFPLYRWTHLAVVKSGTTGVGPGGTCSLSLYVNGVGVPSNLSTGVIPIAGVANASGGTSGVFRVGHELDFSGNVSSNGNLDVAGVSLCSGALASSDVEDDARRMRLLPFYTRADVSVRVTGNNGLEHDLANAEGVDFVDEVRITDEIDQPVATAQVTCLREQEALTLAGLITESKLNLDNVFDPTTYVRPLLANDLPIEILCARVPLGVRASSRDLFSRFKGRIDDVKEGAEATVLECRDLGGDLVDAYCEEEVNYGLLTGVPVEGEMQHILNDNDDNTLNNSVAGLSTRLSSYDPITLYVPAVTGWNIKQYRQRREPVLSALRNLAGQVGGEVRYLFDENPILPQHRLTFYLPLRDRIDVDAVIDPNEIVDVKDLVRTSAGRRKVCRVIYPSTETTLPTLPLSVTTTPYAARFGWYSVNGDNERLQAFVEVWNTVALAEVPGKRGFMELAEMGCAQLDTLVEASTMALACLKDCEEIAITQSVELIAIPEMEINDVHRFRVSRRWPLFTSPQKFAVKQLVTTLGEKATTQLQVRGKPSAGHKRWLRLEARPGQARPGIMDPTAALTDVTPGSLLQVYRNFLDRSSYFKGGKFFAVRNQEFSSFSAGLNNPPDGWSVRAGTWNTDLAVEVSTTLSGGKAIRFLTSTGRLASADFIAISGDPNVPYSVEIKWQRTSGTTCVLAVDLEWYDATLALLATTTFQPGTATLYPNFQPVPATTGVWYQSRADGAQPPNDGSSPFVLSNARFAKIVIRTGASFAPFVVDDVAMYRTARELVTFTLNSYQPTAAGTPSWNALRWVRPAPPFTLFGRYDLGYQCFQSAGLAPMGATTIPTTGESLGTLRGDGYYAREDHTVNLSATYAIASTQPAIGLLAVQRVSALRIVLNATYDANTHASSGGTVVCVGQSSIMVANAALNNPDVPGASSALQACVCNVSARVPLKKGDLLQVEFSRTNTDVFSLGGSAQSANLSIKQDLAQ